MDLATVMTWPLSLLWSGNPEVEQDEPKDTNGSAKEAVSSAVKEVAEAAPSPSHLLQHFEKPGAPPPPSARVGDPKLKQREQQPLSLWQLSKLAAFGAAKGESTFMHELV